MRFKIFLVFMLFSTSIYANDTKDLQQRIFRYIAIDDPIQSSIERKNIIKEIKSKAKKENEIKTIKNVLRSNLGLNIEFQKEQWNCAKLSFKQKKVVKTKRYKELKKSLRNNFLSSLPFKKGSPEYNSALKSYDDNFKVSMKNSEILLLKSSRHEAWSTGPPHNKLFDFTNSKLINATLKGLELKFSALGKLIDEL